MPSLEALLPVLVLISTLLSILLLCAPSRYQAQRDSNPGESKTRFQILVLGDIGRSPRIQFHALSIARHGGFVDIVGYNDSELLPELQANPAVTVFPIVSTPRFLQTDKQWPFLFFGPLKVLFQLWTLWKTLGYRTEAAKWLLVQSPPSIPSIAIAGLVCYFRNTRLVIDWHNLGYTILSLKLGKAHPLVQVLCLYERAVSRLASAHFTVTQVMARMIKKDYKTTAPVLTLHDRPAAHFQPLPIEERISALKRLPETADYAGSIESGKARLVVSPTSWTPDEDFNILLEALVQYSDLAITSHPELPEMVVVVTGKGPLRDYFLDRIQDLKSGDKLEMVQIRTAWLTSPEYARLLSMADLGVSLHKSSSGVDLPMKVVDMFGAGLPVAGWGDFEAWPELVKEGVNGRSFSDALGLRNILMELFGNSETELRSLREGAVREGDRRWDDEWDPIAGRLFNLVP